TEGAPSCLYITHEESEIPVWQQIQSNGSLNPDEIEIRYASSIDELNNLSLEDDFSDEDNEIQEEKIEDAENLRLRQYQRELAETALTGRNCVICAPTGSGKTKVSIKIILEHLKRVPNAKVAFFAKTIPLVSQQFKTIANHLPSNYNVLNITSKSKESLSLHMLLPHYSVVVLTPAVLVNHLCGKRALLSEGITSFTLLVFDECHHTDKDEPYNDIMQYYLKEKRRPVFRRELPQVVGLTASIGINKATDLKTAKVNIMKICGNLDVEHLDIVKKNIVELWKIVPKPDESQEELVENTSNEVGSKITDIMKELEKNAEYYAKHLKELANRQKSNTNPNLERLASKLRENVVNQGADARAIVFVRTRVLAESVVSWLNRCGQADLMGLNARKFTGSHAGENQGGMAVAEQNLTIDHFRSGQVRVIVATSVAEEGIDIPQCNMVIRYNYSRNEVSKVQTRGRSRAYGGKAVLLAMPVVVKRERMNCAREYFMNEALRQISEKSSAQFLEEVNAHQKNLFKDWDLKEMKDQRKKEEFENVEFKLICCGCHKVSIPSSDLKIINDTHRVSINRSLLNKIKIEPSKEKIMDAITFMGTVRCQGETERGKSCNYRIGKLIKHRDCPFVALGCDKMKFLRTNANRPDLVIKRWKDVPYYVEELKLEQFYEYALGIFQPHGEEAAADTLSS
ncbi:dicer-like protein 1, partial [Elysia marginata]